MWANFCLDEGFFSFFFWKNEIQNGRLKKRSFFKIANSQYFFVKISWSGPWVSRIHWCEGHWYGSTYMAVRLSDISSKMAKKHKKCIFGLFLSLCRTPSRPFRLPMPFASMNSTNPATAPWNFHKKILRIGDFEKWPFFESAILNFFFGNFFFFLLHSHENQPKFIW